MTHVTKTTSSSEERNFIKTSKWPKLLTYFYKTFEYTCSYIIEHKIQNMYQEKLH